MLLQKKQKFKWDEEQQAALDVLKSTLTSDTVLVKPDFEKDFYLQTDASDLAISAILAQMDADGVLRPIQYWSKKLNGSELNYHSSEKEAFAIFLAFKKFETFLLLNKTHVLTDAAVVKAFYGCKDISSKRILRWALYVGQFNHTITHVPGPRNALADLISRSVQYPCDVLLSITVDQQPKGLIDLSANMIIKSTER